MPHNPTQTTPAHAALHDVMAGAPSLGVSAASCMTASSCKLPHVSHGLSEPARHQPTFCLLSPTANIDTHTHTDLVQNPEVGLGCRLALLLHRPCNH